MYRILLLSFAVLMLAALITQVFIPALRHQPFFPTFRKSIREAELARDTALSDREAVHIEVETQTIENEAEKLREKHNIV